MSQVDYVAPQMEYKKITTITPKYDFLILNPDGNSPSITETTAGGQQTRFNIPVSVANYSRSYLSYSLSYGATANARFAYQDALSNLYKITLRTQQNQKIVEINDVNNYTNLVWPAETKLDDFLAFDLYDSVSAAPNTASGYGKYLRRTNALSTDIASRRPDNTQPDISYTEIKSLVSNGATGQLGPVLNIKIPLSIIPRSFFSRDVDVYFPEIIYLELQWAPSTKTCFTATAVNDPVTNAAASTTSVAISNIMLYLAQEQNEILKMEVMNKVASKEGFTMLTPYVNSFKIPLSGTSQNLQVTFNKGHGQRLLSLYTAPYNDTESSNTAYDHSNIAQAKVKSLFTYLDSKLIQQLPIVCTNGDDYMTLQDSFKGSLLQSSNDYNYRWFWKQDWTTPLSLDDQPELKDNIIDGIDLSTNKLYQIMYTTANAQYQHYLFAICQKVLRIGGIDSAGLPLPISCE